MREIRITFRREDFGAVAERLVAMGVVFHVEPIKDEDDAAVVPARTGGSSTISRQRQTKRKPPSRKAGDERTEGSTSTSAGAADAAARLRAMAERNRAAGIRPTTEEREAQASAEGDVPARRPNEPEV